MNETDEGGRGQRGELEASPFDEVISEPPDLARSFEDFFEVERRVDRGDRLGQQSEVACRCVHCPIVGTHRPGAFTNFLPK